MAPVSCQFKTEDTGHGKHFCRLVKELRERTAAGMMDCKKALEEANGDIELAIENMRKSGQAKAAKKAGRIAAEGVIFARTEGKRCRHDRAELRD